MTSTPQLDTKVLGQRSTWTLSGKMQPDSTPQTVDVSQSPFRIGRRPDVELSVGSQVVSSTHALLEEKGGMLLLKDLSSTNGTFVNGHRIAGEILLAEGDWIELGDVNLRVGVRKDTDSIALLDTDNGFAEKTQYLVEGAQETSRGLIELLEGRRLGACFQPIHNLNDRDIHGYEFLARSDVAGVKNPAKMFAAAETAGRALELSMLCRTRAIEHSVCLPARLPLFLNTHPSEPLLEEVLPQMKILRDAVPARPLVLEVHEGAIMEPGLVRELRDALHGIDVRLAFDDFGAGQTRFRELICAPSDYIKFDSSLIHDLQEVSTEQFGFFKAIIEGVKGEGALTVAEGVETDEMIEICQEIGFDLLQGFALSHPAMMSPRNEDDEDTAVFS